MTTAVAVFTRDLRVRDNPMLAGAVRGAEHVVPLFVRDDRVTAVSANRTRFLDTELSDVDTSLRERGGDYVRQHVPELSHVDEKWVHRAWELPARERKGYPLPIVDLAEGRARFLAARG